MQVDNIIADTKARFWKSAELTGLKRKVNIFPFSYELRSENQGASFWYIELANPRDYNPLANTKTYYCTSFKPTNQVSIPNPKPYP